MMLLGLDASLRSSGWAILDDDYGLVDMGRITTTSTDGLPVERYHFAQKVFEKILKDYKITHVSAEAVVFGKGEQYSQVPALYAMYITLQLEMLRRAVKTVYFWPSQWYAMHYRTDQFKKLERNNLPEEERTRIELNQLMFQLKDKNDTREYVAEKVGIGKTQLSSDEADAYVIAYYGKRFFDFEEGRLEEEDLTPKEKEVFLKRRTVRKHKGLELDQPLYLEEGTISKKNKAWFDFKGIRRSKKNLLKPNKALRRKNGR